MHEQIRLIWVHPACQLKGHGTYNSSWLFTMQMCLIIGLELKLQQRQGNVVMIRGGDFLSNGISHGGDDISMESLFTPITNLATNAYSCP